MKKILFLYATLEPYILGCLEYFSKKNHDFEIIFVKNDKKKIDSNQKNLKIFSSTRIVNLLDFCNDYNPNLIVISGRMFKNYLKIARLYKGRVKIVTVEDTIFENSFRGLIKILFQKFIYHRYFDYFWGIGSLQTAFALSIGFKKENIFENFYVSNFENNQVKSFFNTQKKTKVLTVARLVDEKNLIQTARLIDKINIKRNLDIKYNIIGEGPLREELRKFKCVNLLGVKNQKYFPKYAKENDLFCLPSKYEPWGVVLHEFSNLGMPLLASSSCGSTFNLLIDGYNGFKFDDQFNFEKKLIQFIKLSDKLKNQMSLNSIQISKKITKKMWACTLKEIFFK